MISKYYLHFCILYRLIGNSLGLTQVAFWLVTSCKYIYIYIYICVCVSVCACTWMRIWISGQIHVKIDVYSHLYRKIAYPYQITSDLLSHNVWYISCYLLLRYHVISGKLIVFMCLNRWPERTNIHSDTSSNKPNYKALASVREYVYESTWTCIYTCILRLISIKYIHIYIYIYIYREREREREKERESDRQINRHPCVCIYPTSPPGTWPLTWTIFKADYWWFEFSGFLF